LYAGGQNAFKSGQEGKEKIPAYYTNMLLYVATKLTVLFTKLHKKDIVESQRYEVETLGRHKFNIRKKFMNE
jgi:hypothetical protein